MRTAGSGLSAHIKFFCAKPLRMKWPDPAVFPYVERTWKHEEKQVDIQYWRLVKQLQSFYKTEEGMQQWGVVKGYTVIPVCIQAGAGAEALCKKLQGCGASQLTASLLCGAVSAYLVGEERPFFLSAATVAKLGYSAAKRGMRLRASQFRGREGSFGSVRVSNAMPRLSGKVVLDENKILVSLDMEQKWNMPSQQDRGLNLSSKHLSSRNPERK